MIATTAVIAPIAEKKKFSDRSDHSDRRETGTFQRSLESGFHMIAAIAEIFLSQRSQRS